MLKLRGRSFTRRNGRKRRPHPERESAVETLMTAQTTSPKPRISTKIDTDSINSPRNKFLFSCIFTCDRLWKSHSNPFTYIRCLLILKTPPPRRQISSKSSFQSSQPEFPQPYLTVSNGLPPHPLRLLPMRNRPKPLPLQSRRTYPR